MLRSVKRGRVALGRALLEEGFMAALRVVIEGSWFMGGWIEVKR